MKDIGQKLILGFVILLFSGMITTCAYSDELKFKNIKQIPVKLVVTSEIYKMEGQHNSETNFYFRVKSPLLKTQRQDFLLSSDFYSSARTGDTLICLVKFSNDLKKEWYSVFSNINEKQLFEIEKVIKRIPVNK